MEGISRTSMLYKWFGKNCGPPNCALICLALALAPAAAHVIGALVCNLPGVCVLGRESQPGEWDKLRF